jgi:hypothetical protein
VQKADVRPEISLRGEPFPLGEPAHNGFQNLGVFEMKVFLIVAAKQPPSLIPRNRVFVHVFLSFDQAIAADSKKYVTAGHPAATNRRLF